MNKLVMVSGGFDPLHSGHIHYLAAASCLGSFLVVGINSDNWLIRKKGAYFLSHGERTLILGATRYVDCVLTFDDSDDSACDFIVKTQAIYAHRYQYVFANGGDRFKENIPEMNQSYEYPVEFVFGVGGGKINASSQILQRWIDINTK